MKRLFLLIAVCLIGMVVPQSLFAIATVTRDGSTVTINADNANDLAIYLQSADATKIEEISGATTIVFAGKFCESDLNALRDKRCCTQKVVDMSEARFVNDYNGADNYTQMKFDLWKGTVEEIVTSKYVTGAMTDQLCSDFQKLKKITLSSGDFTANPNYTKLGSNLYSLETIIIKKEVTALSPGMCDKAGTTPNQNPSVQKLKNVTFEEGIQIETLPSAVFSYTGIENLTIPPSVKEIQSEAFAHCDYLETVTIPENTSLEYIRTNAFQGCDNIADVWVKVSSKTHPICCEYFAFGEYSLVGQTNVELTKAKMATLHFPKDDDKDDKDWNYYAGNWKLGMTCDDQAELNSIKDGCDPSKEGAQRENQNFRGDNTDLNNSFANTSLQNYERGWLEGKSPANGWQQFARTSTGIDIVIPKGKFYRTYSTPSALVKPDWMKIYRVKDFSDGYVEGHSNAASAAEADEATKQAFTEELVITVNGTDIRTYNIIPKNTGVIRVDIRESDALYYFLDLERTSAASAYSESLEYPWVDSGDKLNYMFPTKGEEVTIGPTEKSGNTITHRIFGLLKTTTSGVVPQFSRAKVGTKLGDHRAYLRLPADVFHWKDEQTQSSQDATGNDVVVDTRANAYSKISLFFDEDFEDLNGGIATAIINSIEEDMYKNDSFYTLQGVKVAKPTTKGVYIHNGKKILIK